MHSTPLPTLALGHRRSLLAARSPATLAASLRTLQTQTANLDFPPSLTRPEWWHFASQGAGGFGRTVDWAAVVGGREGGKGEEHGRMWMWLAAEGLDQVMCLNSVGGGWLVSGSLRGDRWRSVERELGKLKAGRGVAHAAE